MRLFVFDSNTLKSPDWILVSLLFLSAFMHYFPSISIAFTFVDAKNKITEEDMKRTKCKYMNL